jgi:membrane protein DedA with SNARE-associated domain
VLDGLVEMVKRLLALNVDLVREGGYGGIVLMMTIESSFIPFPSEIVVPPAGFLAARGEMSIAGVMAASLAGSLLGAWINYWIGAKADGFLKRHGKWFLVSSGSLDKAEAFFRRHGGIGTFVGRLLPGIRQLISIPAGLARMNLARFSFYTALGAGLWCAVLCWIGWSVGKHGDKLELALVHSETRNAFLFVILPGLVLLVGVYVWRQRRRAAAAASPAAAPPPPNPPGRAP